MEIDLGHWASLLHQLADDRFALRAGNVQLGECQERWMAAQAARDRAAGERHLGNTRNADIAAQAARNLAEAEARLVAAESELRRVKSA